MMIRIYPNYANYVGDNIDDGVIVQEHIKEISDNLTNMTRELPTTKSNKLHTQYYRAAFHNMAADSIKKEPLLVRKRWRMRNIGGCQ